MKNIHLIMLFLGSIVLTTFYSCKRDIEGLELATFPTTAEIFIDGFSGGLDYAAFGGSKVTAFDVDTDIKYKGTASMRFEVPDENDPEGAYAGGAYFDATGRDLTGYNVLTFWAKASKSATIDVIGFGNDLEDSRFDVSLSNLAINTNWQKYYIPIPDPSKLTQEKGMFYYAEGPENGLGYTFWIDEVKFENLGTIAHPTAAIMEGQNSTVSAEIGDQISVSGLSATINLPTGIDQTALIAPSYFNFVSSDISTATVNSLGVVTVTGSDESTITATLGAMAATGSLTISSSGVAVTPLMPAPTPMVNPDSVISLYSNAYTNVFVDTWNTHWQFSTAETEEIQINGDDVLKYKNLNFVGIEFVSQTINASEMTHFHIDIWTPNATDLPNSFKILLVDFGDDNAYDGGDDSSHELSFTSPSISTGNWISLDIPLSSFTGLIHKEHLAQLVLSGELPTVYVDNVYFYNSGNNNNNNVPLSSAPTPSYNGDDVLSIFSDAYTDIPGTNLNPDWGQATSVTEVPIFGNNTLLYSGLDYQGIELANSLDVSEMTHLHVDVWSENATALNVYLISTGPQETASAIPVPTSGWLSFDIPLSDFTGVDLMDIIQLKFDGSGDIYLDNILFYKEVTGNAPTTGAPSPTYDAANVISIFSDSYTNVANTNLNPGWGQATITSEVLIDGNNTLSCLGLNYQGIELGSNQDVSGMTHLYLNFWSANSTTIQVFLISPGPVETPINLTVPTSGWSSIDIPLTDFTPVDLTNVFQFKFEGNGDIYFDNILFHN